MRTQPASIPAFLAGDGVMAALMRDNDWSQSPLGQPDSWPQALRTVVDLTLNSKFPMFVAWGPELGFVYNDAYADILGSKHPSALGRRFEDIWREIWQDIHPIVMQAMTGRATYHENLPLKLYRKGYEEQTWFTFSYSPVRSESGEIAGMFCACTETTEQILSARHRDEEHTRLRQLFQQAPGIIAHMIGPDHVFDIANDAYIELVGKRDIVGKKLREALPELDGQGFFELLDRVYATGKPFIGREVRVMLQREPGAPLEERFVNFIYQPTWDHRGQVAGIFLEGSDVTEAVLATQALKDSEQKLRQLANTIPQLAWMAAPDGAVTWSNDRWYEYTGKSFQDGTGWNWSQIVHPDDLDELMTRWQGAIAGGQPYDVTARLRAANGEFHTFYICAAPLRDASGRIVQWFGTNTDVTPLERAQDELKEASRRKDEFLAMLAHELRNPLAPVAAAAELLKRGALGEERIRHASGIIARQVGHMTKLVDDLLDVSRVTRGRITLQEEQLEIGGVVAEAVEQVQSLMEHKQHRLAVQMPEQQFFVNGDRTRLIQALSNLLNNAANYTPAMGNITLRVSADDAHVKLAVQDNGIGIEPALLPQIFGLFIQAERLPDRSQGGLGLGLPLVKSLVELQKGRVWAESAGIGQGAAFIIELPRILPQETADEAPGARSDMPHAARETRLMVVDDNRDAAQTLSLLLETTGHKVAVAHNATDALITAKRIAPTILFLDIGLPDMDGYTLARRLRAMPETADSLLIAVTGYGQPEDRKRAVQAGFNHHLVKPIRLGAILALLSNVET